MRVRSKRGLADVPEQVWIQRGQENALATFRRAARTVPAYRTFLKEHGIRPRDIQTFEHFQQLPTTSKESYLLKHDLAELMPGGAVGNGYVVTCSSGFSGSPLFWPRFRHHDSLAVRGFEGLYALLDSHRKSTLTVNCYSLGVHTAGQCVTDWSLWIARKPGNRITVVTPGASLQDTLEIVRHLSPRFEQTLLWGYPSLLQRIVFAGVASGVSWGDLNTFVACGGEGSTESWRRLMVKALGGAPHPLRVVSCYASADSGLMGFDTPTSILTRSLAHDRPDLQECLFGNSTPVAFVQFNPLSRFFETVSGEFALTCWQGVPLVRYLLRDAGEVLPFSAMVERLESCGISLGDMLATEGVPEQHVWRFPFLSCFGRSDGAISVVGANVYPHSLQHVFAAHPEILHFKLAVEDDDGAVGRFMIYAEWADGKLDARVVSDLTEMLQGAVLRALLEVNADYRLAYSEDRGLAAPHVVIVPKATGPFAEDARRWKRSHIHRGSGSNNSSRSQTG